MSATSTAKSSFRAKCDAIILLVYGYTRQIKLTLRLRYIPTDIIEIIIKYHPTEYQVLSIGGNIFGEFGLNHENANNEQYMPLIKFSSLCYNHHEIYCGFFTFTIRTEDNHWFAAGNNCDGQLGVDLRDYSVNQFQQIPFEQGNIRIFSHGLFSWHRIFVTERGEFYGFGRNKNATLGSTQCAHKNYKPVPLLHLTYLFSNKLNYKVVSIQCGAAHTLFLCSNGKLFSCGENQHGQCGIITAHHHHHHHHHHHRHDGDQPHVIVQPMEVENLPKIRKIAVGEYFSLCISHLYDLWVFGANKHYQLGIPNHRNDYNCYHPLRALMHSHNHNGNSNGNGVIQRNHDTQPNGHDYAHSHGNQSADMEHHHNHNSNQHIELKVEDEDDDDEDEEDKHDCSDDDEYDDEEEDDEDEDLEDEHTDIVMPTLNTFFFQQNIKIDQIYCGESHSLIICSDRLQGYAYCFGQNTHGESLGKFRNIMHGFYIEYNPICFQAAIHDFDVSVENGSCGKAHTMLLTTDNEIYGFGSNDHGQVACSLRDNKIHHPYKLRKAEIGIDEDNHIERVIAGCSTTLIICNRL